MQKAWWKEAVVYQIYPRSFKDYDITWNVEGCREPEIFDFV